VVLKVLLVLNGATLLLGSVVVGKSVLVGNAGDNPAEANLDE